MKDRIGVLEKYKNEDDRLLVSKMLDKISLVEKQNKIQTTDFLSPVELQLLKDVLNMIKYRNYSLYGGLENAQRNIIVMFPEKLEVVFTENTFDYNSILTCIRVTNCCEDYDHKVYLGGLIKLGIKREKIGDIVVYDNGADIVVSKDISKFLLSNLHDLTRFRNCNVEAVKLDEIVKKEQEYKIMDVVVSSLRLDNIVSELSRTSRSKATDILKQERVFINYRNEVKATKLLKEGDLITIRGIGKFVIDSVTGNTKSGKFKLIVKKYV